MPDLRERKKTKAMIAIQEHALKLFSEQGFSATTVEQIAAHAEVSPSTFFRHFPTKESVVLYDSLDPLILEAFWEQPANVGVIRALRNAIKTALKHLPQEKLDLEMQRGELVRAVPELRAAMIDEFTRNIDMFAEAIAKRTGQKSDDLAVRNLAGTLIGVGFTALFGAYKTSGASPLASLDKAYALLEKHYMY